MITGFPKETVPLARKERLIVLPEAIEILKRCVGKEKAITNRQLIRRLSVEISPPRMRKVINVIRTLSLVPCLVATSKGYYVAADLDDLDRYILSLSEREGAIRKVRESLIEQRELI